MKRLAMVAVLAGLLGASAAVAPAGEVEADLEAVLAEAGEEETVSALVYLWDRVDLDALTEDLDRSGASLAWRHELVVRMLQERAAGTQGAVLGELAAMEKAGLVEGYRAYWITNVIAVEGTRSAIEAIAAHAEVERAYLNYDIQRVVPTRIGRAGGALDSRVVEVGVEAVRAPEAWALGITGEGVLVSTLDTGVDGNHPALASRWRGVADPRYAGHPEWAFFDPVTGWTFPQDAGTHGTHTMGSVCGGSPGDEIGVAPGAQWIHAAVIDRISIPDTIEDAIEAFQWLIDPNEDPSSVWDVPAVCSNSWGLADYHGYPDCDETFWEYLDACEAAGIVILFSAGNEGSSGLRRPSDRATDDYRTCAVGAVDAHDPAWPVADFSSRGPTYCTPDGTAATKPDVAAPGVDVRSSVPGGGYQEMDGTSMASPHVNGVVALIKQACPELTPTEVKQILYDTAYDLGSPGEDNDYGWGMVDAYEAVLMAMELCSPSPPKAEDGYYETAVDTEVPIELIAKDYDGEPDPPGMLVYKIDTLPEQGGTLTDPGNGHEIGADELPYELVSAGNLVLYMPAEGFWGLDSFQFVADDGGVPPEGGESDPATIEILVAFGPPAIVTTGLPDGYLDQPYGPFQLEAEQGQPELVWSIAAEDLYGEEQLGENQFEEVGKAQGWQEDDQTWKVNLPFAFPFYGQEQTSLFLSSNGWLNFGDWTGSQYGNSDELLIANKRICALWDDLKTNGPGNDIYVDKTTPGQITFRWDATTFDGAHAVNFSCTLYENGKMRFHYGEGNEPLTPTVGISNGDGDHYLLSVYNKASSLAWADSVEVYPPAPMPEGMELTAEGVLQGTPAEFGEFEPRFRVTDSLGRSDEKEFTLLILQGVLGDLDGDGDVDVLDLLTLLAAWGPCPNPDDCLGDLSGDGVVDVVDLLLLLANWT